MNHEQFWTIIDTTRQQADGDLDEHLERLREALVELPPDDIIEFSRIFDEYWIRAYHWDLWGAAYVIGGGCSDDGFMDFRGWLISKGFAVYDAALKNCESLIDVITDADEGGQFEGFHYVAGDAWEEVTGRKADDFPQHSLVFPRAPAGKPWPEDTAELAKRFPRLSARFG